MINLIKKSMLFLMFFFSLNLYANEYVIVLANNYPSSFNKEDLVKVIDDFVLSEMKLGDNLLVINSENLKEVAQFSIPNTEGYDSPNVKKRQFAKGLIALKKSILEIPVSDDPNNQSLLSQPQVLKHLSQYKYDTIKAKINISVMMIGSALYQDKEKIFDFTNGIFASDGHILANDSLTPFGTANKVGFLKNFYIHQLETNKFFSEIHMIRVHRFWSLFVKNQSGKLVTQSNEMQTVFDRFKKTDASVEEVDFDRTKNKVEMLKATRIAIPVGSLSEDAEFMGNSVEIATQPPSSTTGKMKIGIKWLCECDLDLYARSDKSQKYLYFNNAQSSDGRYFKDFQSSTAINGLEYVQITRDVDINNMDIKVNFYGGTSDEENGVSGIVRAEYENKIYEQPFHISTKEGNRGNTSDESYWTTINLAELLKIQPSIQPI